MSMGDLPPRQKMISMMYLVLLALLAMNVSKEILNSFVIINEGLERTNGAFDQKNEYTMAEFGKKRALDAIKVGPYYNAAKQVRDLSKELDDYIHDIKVKIIAGVEQIDEDSAARMDLMHVSAKDNADFPTTLLIGHDETNPIQDDISAYQLESRIKNFNETIKTYISDVLPAKISEGLDLEIKLEKVKEGDKEVSWIIGNFYHTPIAAVVTNLSRIQAEIKNVEAEVLRTLFNQISADDFAFDNLKVAVLPTRGTYVTVGDSFRAEVLIAAYSSTSEPLLKVGNVDTTDMSVSNADSTKIFYKNGIANYFDIPRTPGEYEWGGILYVTKPNGEKIPYQFSSKYTAAKPSLVVSPTKMNVFYRGLPNPIDVSVPGVPADKLTVTVTNGSIEKEAAGKFVVSPGKDRECMVNVTAEMNGTRTSFPGYEFRVKPVPPPTPSFLGEKGAFKMSKAKAASGKFVSATLDDFLFDLRYTVKSFKMTVSVSGKSQTMESRSNELTPKMKSLLGSMSSGQSVIIKEIIAQRVPGGSPEPLNGNLIIEIQ